MDKYEIGFSDEFTYNGIAIKYDISKNDNILHLYVEDCAKALGIVDYKKLKDGSISQTVRWNRVYGDLVAIERIANLGDFKNLDNEAKKRLRKDMKSMTITESELYLWSFVAQTETCKNFREWLANIVLPNLREYGIYIDGMENMTPEEIKIQSDVRIEKYILRKWGIGIRKSVTDAIKKAINPSKDQSYIYAKYTNLIYNVIYGMDCKELKEDLGLNEKDNLRDCLPSSEIDIIGKAEDFMCNLLTCGITDYNQLYNMLSNWYDNINPNN